ncbi:MoaD/ThiS family protein [Youngiibacter multivorans]|uniref:Molybdopterin converting factor small subunit n=1 Tax=Youngiibacter multivorans TaxID=937251 RepID=A0ABS4G416_9CLOT|nr:MoaD/ThiS family protein [Youngiibacter multivorans]MBP1919287.1 molybdopterin converting factor small subunit [Youngiibacter multivorans]
MGTIELRGYAAFKKLFGDSVTFVEIETPCSIEECMDKLDATFDYMLKSMVYDEAGNQDIWVRILLNGREIAFLKGQNRMVKDKDILLFIPVLGGG